MIKSFDFGLVFEGGLDIGLGVGELTIDFRYILGLLTFQNWVI